MKAYRCKICGTGYSTTGDSPPPSPNWADGHVCEMVEVESKLDLFEPSRMNIDKAKSFDINKKSDSPPPPGIINPDDEDEANKRMNIIAQNGNTGEHYD